MTDLPPLSQVLTFDCSNIQWITPVHGFLGSTINQVNQINEHDPESGPRFTKAHDTMKLSNYDFTHTALSNMMNRAF